MLKIPAENCLQLTYQLLTLPAMHLAQQLRKDSNGEQLIGLIDGVAVIALTLLFIEIPIIIQGVEHAGGISQIHLSIGMDLMGRFPIPLTVYDIWSIQKNLF